MTQEISVSVEILETRYLGFKSFIEKKDGKPFSVFRSSAFLIEQEGYKGSLYKAARQNLSSKFWRIEDIGEGKIQQHVASAILNTVEHGGYDVSNNLIFWMNKRILKAMPASKPLDTALYDLYKSRVSDEKSFDRLQVIGLNYQTIAYLFFIKDQNVFTPISQEKFDEIFKLIGVHRFKTSHNISWSNYKCFVDIIKQVRSFLKTKDKQATLLDAHSFLWVLGNQMMSENPVTKEDPVTPPALELEREVESPPEYAPPAELPVPVVAEEDEASAFPEGAVKYIQHKKRGRSRELIQAVKERALKADAKLCCQVCGFSFIEAYGPLGEGFIEAHHLVPISELEEDSHTKLDDLALVCSNCHRMLHRRRPWLALEDLTTLLQSKGE